MEYSESVYEVKKYDYNRLIRKCDFCKRCIEDEKYICAIIHRYDIKGYYHFKCYKICIEMDEIIDGLIF